MKKGETMSAEQKAKLSKSLKARPNGNGLLGTHRSNETKKKISESNKGKHFGFTPMKGRRHTAESKEKNRLAHFGKKPTEKQLQALKIGHGWNKGMKSSNEWKERVRLARIGTVAGAETKEKMRLSAKREEKSPVWKGEDVGYRGLHKWVERKLGRPDLCEHCGGLFKGKAMHWANIDHSYKRKISDWLRLCASCHGKHDKKLNQ